MKGEESEVRETERREDEMSRRELGDGSREVKSSKGFLVRMEVVRDDVGVGRVGCGDGR